CGQLSSEVLCGFISGSVSISAGAAGLAAGRGRISSYFYMVTSAILSVLAACLGTLAIALLGLTFARGGTDSDFSVSDGLRVVLFLLELCVAVMQTALAGRYACCPASSAVAPNGGAQVMSELAVTVESGRAPPAYPGWATASWKVNVPSPPTYEEALAGPALSAHH
uniref:DUF4345 domain-containing protein n=1 Tax=Macrostomum lignano TaxID=282301 RepID=A0A1I8IMR0_9PLAT